MAAPEHTNKALDSGQVGEMKTDAFRDELDTAITDRVPYGAGRSK